MSHNTQDATVARKWDSKKRRKSSSRPKNAIMRLLDYAGSRKKLSILGCIFSGLHAVLSVMPLVCVWFVVREFVAVAPAWEQATGAAFWGWLAVAFAVVALLVYFAALMCTHLAAFRTAANMRKKALDHMARVPLGYFSEKATGHIRRIIDGCAGQTEDVLAHKLPDFVGSLVTPFAFLVVMFVFDWVMGLVCLIPLAVSFFCLYLMLGRQGKNGGMQFMMLYQNALDKMNKAATEYVRGIPVVKVFQQTVHSFRAFHEAIIDYRDMAFNYSKSCQKPQVAQLVAINATFAVLVPAGILLAQSAGDFSRFLTDFMFYVIFSAITTTMMTKVMYASEAVMMAQDSVRRIEEVMAVPVQKEAPADEALMPRDASVEFEQVDFVYPGSTTPALRDFTLSIKAGMTIALVGPSGSGKTTAARLVPRFWDVGSGVVRVGGVDVRRVSGSVLMQQVAFVFQNDHVFKRSLLENIRAARPEATRKEVAEAAKAAQCNDIIEKLPDGLDTVIGTKGVYLSGGECQRIALARAILKDAPIVVLDEATAFADPENEVLIQKALKRLCAGKTVLLIAHRLSTVAGADMICVLSEGRLVESGNHDALLAREGLYARMWADYKTSVAWKVGRGESDVA